MADRVAVLREGDIKQAGPPRLLYERPQSRFVADFLGETNFLAATVASADDAVVTLETPVGPLASAAGLETSPRGGNVTCSIRPEALRVVDEPGGRNVLTGKRVQTIYLGEVAQYLVELDDGTVVRVLEMHPSHLGEPGDILHMAIKPEDVVLLPD